MERLIFIVEGDAELFFVEKKIIPYLYSNGLSCHIHAQKITTNRKLNRSGGNISYEYLTNELNRIFAQGNVIVTTFLDFFRIPTNFPGYNTGNPDLIEEAMRDDRTDLRGRYFPYIQKHEFEALFFSNLSNFDLFIESDVQRNNLLAVIDNYPNPEDINNRPNTYPAKRLEVIFNYQKGADAELIIESSNIGDAIEKCPRFRQWINSLINIRLS